MTKVDQKGHLNNQDNTYTHHTVITVSKIAMSKILYFRMPMRGSPNMFLYLHKSNMVYSIKYQNIL
jgi:hypothetical protein